MRHGSIQVQVDLFGRFDRLTTIHMATIDTSAFADEGAPGLSVLVAEIREGHFIRVHRNPLRPALLPVNISRSV